MKDSTLKIEYFNDGKCKHMSWEARLYNFSDPYASEDLDITGYGEHKREAYEDLIVKVQKALARAHLAILEAEVPPPDTSEERAERHRGRYGYLY